MVKKLFLLTFVVGVVLLCMFSITSNKGYATFLKVQNSVNMYRISKEISSIENKLTTTYREIGQNISTEDITKDQIKKEINDLVNLSRQYLLEIDYKKKRIITSKGKLTKEILFEDLLENLFSDEASIRLETLRTLNRTYMKESLPYLGLLLVDPELSVRQEAGSIINQIISSSSEEIRRCIPNLEYLNGNNYSKI